MYREVHLAFDDPKVPELGPWFAEIAVAHKAGPNGVRELLQHRWKGIAFPGVRHLRDRIVSGIPQSVVVVSGESHYLCMAQQIRPTHRDADTPVMGGWFMVPPSSSVDQVRSALSIFGSNRSRALDDFYLGFNGLSIRSSYFADVTRLRTLDQSVGSVCLPCYRVDAIEEMYGSSDQSMELIEAPDDSGRCFLIPGPNFKPKQTEEIQAPEWLVIYRADWDSLIMSAKGKLVWLIGNSWGVRLPLSFDDYVSFVADNLSVDADEFFSEYVGGYPRMTKYLSQRRH